MGNKQVQSFETRFHSKYTFNQLFDDPNFGMIKVFRKKELNYDYVMVLQKYVNSSVLNSLVREIKSVHQAFLKADQPMALRIFNYEIIQDQWSECKMPMIRVYVEYFNFTLHHLLHKKQEKDLIFSREQIMYILYAILHTYDFFSSLNIQMVSVHSKCIYLSPEGSIKFTPVKVQDFHQSPDAFCNAIWYETKEKDIVKFERRDKQLLSEIKKLFTEISKIYYKIDYKNRTKILIREIIKANSLNDLRKIVVKPETEFLIIAKKQGETTDSIDSRISHQGYEKAISVDVRSTGKLSVKHHKTNSPPY